MDHDRERWTIERVLTNRTVTVHPVEMRLSGRHEAGAVRKVGLAKAAGRIRGTLQVTRLGKRTGVGGCSTEEQEEGTAKHTCCC